MTQPDQNKLEKVRSNKMFDFSYPEKITEKEARELQLNAGYDPAGYGFYLFKTTDMETTWVCATSCE